MVQPTTTTTVPLQSEIRKTNKKILLAITLLANFINPFTGSAVNIALPHIAGDLHLNAGSLSWVTMAYLLASAVFLVPMGKVGDRWGRKTLFLWGNILFLVASFACAFSQHAYWLIGCRLLQGVGGAMMVSVSMAIVTSAFEPSERGRVIGFNVASVYLGLSAAPVLGGLITQYLGWRSLFLVNGCVSLFVVAAIYLAIHEDWKVKEEAPFDWWGVCWYIPSLLMLMYGFSKLPDPFAIAATGMGLAGLIWFVRKEAHTTAPLLNVRLFSQNVVFGLSNLSAFINYAATFAVSFVLSLYLQYIRLLSPRDAGFILMAQPVVMAIISILSGRLSDKYPSGLIASFGMGISVVGLLMLAFLSSETSQAYILCSLGVLGLGFGLFSSPNTHVVMSSVESHQTGLASSTLATMRNLGMMFSMAVATLVVHVFLGSKHFGPETAGAFLKASKWIFSLFSVLSLIGVFASLKRVKRSPFVAG